MKPATELERLLGKDQCRELEDLTREMVQRARKATMSVGQLIESDTLRAAALTATAVDLLRGAASLIATTGEMSERAALDTIVEGIVERVKKRS